MSLLTPDLKERCQLSGSPHSGGDGDECVVKHLLGCDTMGGIMLKHCHCCWTCTRLTGPPSPSRSLLTLNAASLHLFDLKGHGVTGKVSREV